MKPAVKIERRHPSEMMRLKRLGCLHQCRLSFMRILTRRMARGNWRFTRPLFDINDKGVGRAVYTAHATERPYSLVAFAHDLPDEMRSDRVIAQAWDATFALFDGIPAPGDIDRLEQNVPFQEAGRLHESELSMSRANRSVRLWNHVTEALARGEQPDIEQIDEVGYLMRTTAVYGSGKFGAADFETVSARDELQAPFQAEMLSVYLTRAFVRDLAERIASAKGGANAVRLEPALARRLGIGNSTGLGMAPFLVHHPVLFNNWIMAREEAVARVRALESASSEACDMFGNMLKRGALSVEQWRSDHPVQIGKLTRLKADIRKIEEFANRETLQRQYPWNQLMTWAADALTEEGQEWLASLMLEPYGELVDGLASCMSDGNRDAFTIDGAMSVEDARVLIKENFGWAFDIDWNAKENCARAWYVSEEKLEPRLGERFEEDVFTDASNNFEQPLAPARDGVDAYKALEQWDGRKTVAEFLLRHPEHRYSIRRAQTGMHAPYGEIHDNTIGAALLPIDMLRAKLSFFGATHFDPRSDRWVRIRMYAGAPYPDELDAQNADFWVYPEAAA